MPNCFVRVFKQQFVGVWIVGLIQHINFITHFQLSADYQIRIDILFATKMLLAKIVLEFSFDNGLNRFLIHQDGIILIYKSNPGACIKTIPRERVGFFLSLAVPFF